MLKKLGLCILTFFSVTIQIQAYIGSLAHYRKGAKKVLVIGDWHVKNKADKRDFTLLKQLIADLNIQEKPVCWLHEGNQDIYEEWKYTADQATVTALLCNAYYHNLHMGHVRFYLADQRYHASRIFTDMLDYCSGFYTHNELSEYYQTPDSHLENTKLAYADIMSESHYVTGLVKEIDDVIQQLAQVKPLLPVKALKITEPLTCYLQEAKDIIIRFFKRKNKRQLKSIFKTAIANETIEPLRNLIYTRDPLLSDLADAGLIAQFLKNQVHYDTLILFIGDYHTININALLEASGYKIVQQKGEWLDMAVEKKPFSKQVIKKFFNKFLGVSDKVPTAHKFLHSLFQPTQFISNQVGRIVEGL